MKPVAVFRFSDTEGPGHFATFLDANRVPWKLVKLDEGDAVPASSEAFAGLAFVQAHEREFEAVVGEECGKMARPFGPRVAKDRNGLQPTLR